MNENRKNHLFRWGILALMGVCTLSSCDKIISSEQKVEPVPVEVQVISEVYEAGMQNYVGTIEASSSSALTFSTAGRVARVCVREGQRVSAGQLLAELDDATYQENYTAAQATLRQAQDGYDRLKQLHDKGSITEVQWVEMETKLAQAKAAEAVARKNLENCKLYAPFAGVIGQCDLAAGMNTMPGVNVISLLQTGSVQVNVPIPENVISDIKVGRPAIITVSALGNRRYNGKVQSKGVVANPLSHNYEVLVPLHNADGMLMPGMVCGVQMPSADTAQLITLPNRVVKVDGDGAHFVWVVNRGQAQQRMVTTGGLGQRGIIITDGLSRGDSVIVNGEQKVSTGSKVVIK